MSESLTYNTIEQLQRAIFAQISPLSGTRATGTISITTPAGGADVTLQPNTYLVPLVANAQVDYTRAYKIAPNPATQAQNGAGGAWTIAGNGATTSGIRIKSNIGGLLMNLPAGNKLRFSPSVPGLNDVVTLDAAMIDGSNLLPSLPGIEDVAGQPALCKRMTFWEQLGTPEDRSNFFKSGVGTLPALLLAWGASNPLAGRTTGGRQGDTRNGRFERAMRETFICFCGSGLLSDATPRRNEALVLMQAASRLLSDRSLNIDLEPLSTMGAGIEITQRALHTAEQTITIYTFRFDVNQMLEQLPLGRTFGAWRKNRVQAQLPGREAPEPTTPITEVDATDPMP